MKELVGLFLLPPAPFLFLMLIGFCWPVRGTRNAITGVASALLLLTSLPITNHLLSMPLYASADRYNVDRDGPLPIFVPTAGVYQDSTGKWWPEKQSILRYQYAKKFDGQIFLVGGNPIVGSPSEAEVIFSYFPEDRDRTVVVNEGANSIRSAEALKNAFAIPSGTVHLVTSPSHILRMFAALTAQGFEVKVTPAGKTFEKSVQITDFLPGIGGLLKFRSMMYEYFGIVLYLIRGDISLKDLFSAASWLRGIG